MIDKQKIAAMRAGGKKLAIVRSQVIAAVKPGISLSHLDSLAEKLLLQSGGQPGFKLVPGYKWSTCINVNSGIVHGVPHAYIILKNSDIVTIDLGLFYQGFHTDAAATIIVGYASQKVQDFLKVGQNALKKSIKQAKPGNFVGHISQAIEQEIVQAGYSCARHLTGHGIGSKLHEPPTIPCILKGPITSTPKLTPGMTLAIEAIYAQGNSTTVKTEDNWTIATKDKSLSAVFEETVLITSKRPEILTK